MIKLENIDEKSLRGQGPRSGRLKKKWKFNLRNRGMKDMKEERRMKIKEKNIWISEQNFVMLLDLAKVDMRI
jgi:hypothetical protein